MEEKNNFLDKVSADWMKICFKMHQKLFLLSDRQVRL